MNLVKYIVAFVVIVALIYFGLVALDAFSPEAFSVLAASILAIAFERFPYLKEAWDELTPEGKQLGMWIMLFVLIAGAFGLSCAGLMSAYACNGVGIADALVTLFLAIAFNQGAYKIVRRPA